MSRVKEESILLNSNRAAELIGCSSQTLRNWNLYGFVPPPIVLGHRLFWKREEILQWLEAGCPNRKEWKKNKQTFQQNTSKKS